MHKGTFIDWIRLYNHYVSNASVIWTGFIRVFGWVSKPLSWKVSSGAFVMVGTNPIVGLDKTFFLLRPLVEYLHYYSLMTLD